MFFVFYLFRVLLLPHGVRIFGTHRFEKFGLWRQRHLPHRLWKKGTYQKSFLGGKLRAFCRLHLIAKWSCFIYVISDLFCQMSILYFFIFFKKSCLDLKSGAVMVQWREKVTWPKKTGNLVVSFRIIWHYGRSGSIGLWRQKYGIDSNET